MFIENEYTVRLSEIDRENKATNKAILSYLEDIGGIHSNIAGYGIYDIPKTHLTWVLIEWKLQIIRRPNYAEKVKVITWSRNALRCYAFRDFEIYDQEGNVIALAASKWVLVNMQKGKIERIEPELIAKYEPELDKSAFEGENFAKIIEPEKYQMETEYVVRKADIDINNHMHNLNYMDLANEALPENIFTNKQFNNIRITYKKEIKLGEIVKCKYGTNGEKHVISIKSQDDKTLHALIELS